MRYDTIIVGGGASGLTAAAYLAKHGASVLLLEKEHHCGGLVNSFTKDGFVFDGGIRALENAGVLFPMLKKLGVEVDFVKNHISLGIEDQIINIENTKSLAEYEQLLKNLYPESADEITEIVKDIVQITKDIDIQYGINNPLFLDIKEDREYFMKHVFPWMFKYMMTVPRVAKKNVAVMPYLEQFTSNPALLDIITQHFFTDTPAYFALSYFSLFQDYFYPRGGTGTFIQQLTDFIRAHGGEIQTDTAVAAIDPEAHTVSTAEGETFTYRNLVWTADQKTLYKIIDLETVSDPKMVDKIQERIDFLSDMAGNNSIFTLYLQSNLDPDYFGQIATEHFFYTPSRAGQSRAGEAPLNAEWDEVKSYLERYLGLTTYEISIPALRDCTLAPEGKTGLIISVLFDYALAKHLRSLGHEDDFRDFVGDQMIAVLERSVYPGLAGSVEDRFTSTPLTIEKIVGTADGAITGWSFSNEPMPAENRLVKISNSVKTPVPDIYQAGQWTYSPSGFPVSLITGKVAADQVIKQLKKK